VKLSVQVGLISLPSAAQRDDVQRRWSLLFSIASMITLVLLGIVLGAVASGTIRVENGVVVSGFLKSWLAPFPFALFRALVVRISRGGFFNGRSV
jgi:cytochrome bd-type quinol oxidase subunit 2